MRRPFVRLLAPVFVLTTALAAAAFRTAPGHSTAISMNSNTGTGLLDTAVFAGGCFWGIEGVFEHVKGVRSATSGYTGGSTASATYDAVSGGRTGHAEAVRVVFDPAQVSFAQLLHVFFAVAHDPTQLNRQGPDVGTQYRSGIYYASDAQKRLADAYVAQLTAAKTFPRPIVTEIVALGEFYPAEAYHQDYMARHPTAPYVVFHDAPKVERLRRHFPALYVAPDRRGS